MEGTGEASGLQGGCGRKEPPRGAEGQRAREAKQASSTPSSELGLGRWQFFPPEGWKDANVKNEFYKAIGERYTTGTYSRKKDL